MDDDRSYTQTRWNPPGLLPLRDSEGREAARLAFMERYILPHRPYNEVELREAKTLRAALASEPTRPHRQITLAQFEAKYRGEHT